MTDNTVPTGRYQSVRTAVTSEADQAQPWPNIIAVVKTNQSTPKAINGTPSRKGSSPAAATRSLQGPGFSGPTYFPVDRTCIPSNIIQPPTSRAASEMRNLTTIFRADQGTEDRIPANRPNRGS